MPVVDAIVRRGDRGKRITGGPNALEGPKATRSRSPFSSITRITGTTDYYEITNPYGLAPGNYTIYVRPINRNGLSLDGVGRVAVIKQANGRNDPNATPALVALKRPNSVDSPLVLGPFAVTTADRLFVVLERKGVAEVKYQLQLEGPDSALRDELWAKAGAVPSLDLRLATNKSLIDTVTGQNLVTFTRASAGTYVGSDGLIKTAAVNEPRFDHNPTTGECLGLLVEEQRTNLLVQSENFGTTWTTTGLLAFGSGSTLNAATAPDGTQTADLLTENTSNSEHRIETAAINWAASTTYTLSIFVKANGRTRLDLFGVGGGNFTGGREADFNLTTGAVVSTDGATASVQSFPNGWLRLRMTFTTSASPSASSIFIRLNDTSGNFSYTGDGASGIYLWGAQLEAGAFPTSYIPTTASAATRSADVASISGSAFSGWYRQDEGSVYVDFSLPTTAGNTAIVSLSQAAAGATNRHSIRQGNTIVTAAGSLVANFTNQTTTVNTRNKIGYGYKVNDFYQVLNGSTFAADTSGALPSSIDLLEIGKVETAGLYSNGPIRRLTYWPQRLPNTTLQALTQ